MRIVIDMQGAQTGSRFRGIGRYTMALALAMVKNGPGHEFVLALNGLFPETIEPIKDAFHGLVPSENIRVWHSPGPVHAFDPNNASRKNIAELIREEFLLGLAPDIVHITSLIEGFGDNAVHSIGRAPFKLTTAVTFYDLIPLIQSDVYLKPNPDFERLYREKINFLNNADLMLAISDSSRREALEYLEFSDEQVVNISAAVDDIFRPLDYSERSTIALNEKYRVVKPYFMYSGATDDRKNHLGLIDAYSLLPSDVRESYQLLLVGGLPNDHRYRFEQYILKKGLSLDDVIITGRVTDDELVQFYNQCYLYIFPSQHEGFGLPVLEAMSCGAASIGSNTTSIPEVIGIPEALFDPYSPTSIAEKIIEVLNDLELYSRLKHNGIVQAAKFTWDISAQRTIRAFEKLYDENQGAGREETFYMELCHDWLIKEIANHVDAIGEKDLERTAQCIASNTPSDLKQLLIDVSELVQRDSKTGVQRVVRGILRELLINPPVGFSVEPVFATEDKLGYRYARSFTHTFMGHTDTASAEDSYIDFSHGDIFLGLDMQHRVQPVQSPFYRHLRDVGVEVYFVVYDLLPLISPGFFPAGTFEDHKRWISLYNDITGFICISDTVSSELKSWLKVNGKNCSNRLKVEWFHIGADIENSNPSKGMPDSAIRLLENVSNNISFLQVGTLEPRKGQAQTLEAFEQLWTAGNNSLLVIVGKRGWNVDDLVAKIQTHPQLNKKLFWLEGVSDEFLEELYAKSTCLIAASEGEGFGLPLIESAQHGLPIIARNLAVFKEVAGRHAYYFDGRSADALGNSILEWLALYSNNEHPKSDSMSWLTWRDSAAQLKRILLGDVQ